LNIGIAAVGFSSFIKAKISGQADIEGGGAFLGE
jgi:hypothetical protein